VVGAVWVDNMLVIGMLKSLGVLFPEFRAYFQESAGAISWINSISLSMRATAGEWNVAERQRQSFLHNRIKNVSTIIGVGT